MRSAGSSVIASSAATIMVSDFVYASGLKRRPSCASSVSTGRKATAITSSVKNAGAPTSLIAARTISAGAVRRSPCCQRSSFLCVCSTTTIDASTSAPTAIAIPPSDMMFALRPNRRNGTNATRTAIGIVTIGTSALGTCQRNIMITTTTTAPISSSADLSVSIDRSTSCDRS